MRTVHAHLTDPDRYAAQEWPWLGRWGATVTADGRWVHSEGAKERANFDGRTGAHGASEYLCDDHPFLGWINEVDWGQHCHSRSHREAMPWRDKGYAMARWRYLSERPQ